MMVRVYGDEDKSFGKDRRISQRACQSQNKVYHLSAAALQSYAFFCYVVFLLTKNFGGRVALAFSNDADPVNCAWLRLVSAACKVDRSRLPVLFQRFQSAHPLRHRAYLHQSRAERSLYARKNARNAVPTRKAL